MESIKTNLLKAESIAIQLFHEVENRDLIVPYKTELELNQEIHQLAEELFGIKKHWHKRIVRSGENTLYPYKENPPNRMIQSDDILFFDFGPIIQKWEADLGRTYVIGNNNNKLKLKNDIEKAWLEVKNWFLSHSEMKACDVYLYAVEKAKEYGWEFGGEIAGHLVGEFPHEKLESGNYGLYIHPLNNLDLFARDEKGNTRHWILELHFVDLEEKIGGFYEQLLN
jgi:Xaa-Pro aminopeptidase